MDSKCPLQFHYHYPDDVLSDFVKCFWCLENNSSKRSVTILPDGYFDIVLSSSGNGPLKILLIGLANKAKNYIVPADSRTFAISFKLPAAESILKRSIGTLLNKRSSLPDNLWNVSWDRITSPEHFFTIVAECLIKLAPTFTDNRKYILFENIYRVNGNIRVTELAQLTSWDPRKINRYFRRNFGLTLKLYCNILRFRSTFEHLCRGTGLPHEYFDQSHFIREVRNFSGTSPKHLVANQNERFIQLSTLPNV
jgi:AraC-like DNA-binding protein